MCKFICIHFNIILNFVLKSTDKKRSDNWCQKQEYEYASILGKTCIYTRRTRKLWTS